ncbi:MAG TPA: hypothetical protein VMX56_00425 [Anaerolineales bacterium]|nr:hypothetical protein [Anaerolineales bacterium]HUS83580.1 hypothetical protein [Anaerolineales bacterium]
MSSTERLKILKMIDEGKITAEEGTQLLGALKKQEKHRSGGTEGEARWLRIRVSDLNSGKETVRVNLPIGLVNIGMKMGARFVPEIEEEAVMEDLAKALTQGVAGKIIDIVDEADGQRVEIFIE